MRSLVLPAMLALSISLSAQETPNPRPLKIEEYEKAKTFTIKNMDEETYAKFENAYILDRYEMRKPYFITGDDGLKKRIDLYNFIAKDGMQSLGVLIFYTNEKNQVYKALLPNFTADSKVWEKYFEDIHAIDKVEKNFVLKLSYVMSKELGFQVYKSLNQGKDLAKESATYGNDICFPGNQEVTLADGRTKKLADIRSGDLLITIDTETSKPSIIKVDALVEHEAKNYAITKLLLLHTTETINDRGIDVAFSAKVLEATPNHPMMTTKGEKSLGDMETGNEVLCYNEISGTYVPYRVFHKEEIAVGKQKVYNIMGSKDTPFLMNGVMVLQK